jgi:hypothetical protein
LDPSVEAGKLTIGRQKEVGGILSFAPTNLVNLLLNLQTLQVVEFGLVGLEFSVKLVLASFFLSWPGIQGNQKKVFS